jgi:hypothetical protein
VALFGQGCLFASVLVRGLVQRIGGGSIVPAIGSRFSSANRWWQYGASDLVRGFLRRIGGGSTVPAILSAVSSANSCDPTVVRIHGSQLFASVGARNASKGLLPDRMERLRELIRGKSATSLNIGEHVISSRGGYYSNTQPNKTH